MSDPTQKRAYSREASFPAVASTDPVSFVVSLMLFGAVAIVIAIYVHSLVTGIQPKESWTEVSLGVALIATAAFIVILYRVRSINRLLSEGTRLNSHVVRFLAVGMWVIIQLKYERQGVQTERKIWLANSRRSRKLGRASEVTLAIEPTNSIRLVIADLFVRKHPMRH